MQMIVNISFLTITFASMILTELIWIKWANFLLEESLLVFCTPLIFSLIAFGNFISLKIKLNNTIGVVGISTLISTIGIYSFPHFNIFWIAVPFVAWGMCLVNLYQSHSLKEIVFAGGIGGILAVFFLFLSLNYWGEKTIFLPVLLNAVLLFRNNKIFGLLTIVVSAMAIYAGFYKAKTRLELELPFFSSSQREIEPIFKNGLRTDLVFIPSSKKKVILTNGQRFAVVPNHFEASRRNRVDAKFLLPYDLPYAFAKPKNVLIIGPAEGQNVLSAHKFKANHINTVDINPAVYEIFDKYLKNSWTDNFYFLPNVNRITHEGRGFLEKSQEKYDLITIQGVQTGTHSSGVNASFLESFLTTDEALKVAWEHLSEEGVLFIDEYEKISSTWTKNYYHIARTASRLNSLLNISNPEKQIYYFNYEQDSENPNTSKWDKKLLRGSILLFKTEPKVPIKDTLAAIEFDRPLKLREVNFFEMIGTHPTDNRPFAMIGTRGTLPWLARNSWFFLFACLVILYKFFKSQYQTKTVNDKSMFLIGSAFMLLLMSIEGPLSLLLGNPALASVIVILSFFMGGLIGGLLSLNINSKKINFSIFILFLIILITLVIFVLFKSILIKPFFGKEVLFGLLILILASVVEISYIGWLSIKEDKERGWFYFMENLGGAFGMLLGFILQIQFGFVSTILASAAIYLSLYLMARVKQ